MRVGEGIDPKSRREACGAAALREPAAFVPLSRLRKLRDCEQVAAVCYRVGSNGIEFLLVRTRSSGRWTFPKGSAEPGLTHAQAAALEAFEEAGVHGRIEEVAFARYIRRKPGDGRKSATGSGEKETAVHAHLCEVSRLSAPQESKRNRTWFSAQDTRQRLREGRDGREGIACARVVDRAVARIQKLRGGIGLIDGLHRTQGPAAQRERAIDALQRVQFEFLDGAYRGIEGVRLGAQRRLPDDDGKSAAPIVDARASEIVQGAVLQFVPAREMKPKALGTGTKSR